MQNCKKMIVCGATSGIAVETMRDFAKEGTSFLLIGRDSAKLEMAAEDLRARGAASVDIELADLADVEGIGNVAERAMEKLPDFDSVLVAHGILGKPEDVHTSYAAFEQLMRINFLGVVAFLLPLVASLKERKQGTIGVISSVAGDRGRKSNYGYGTSKAALSTWLQGLRADMQEHGVKVVTIKPGFVDTAMTADIKKGPLFASAEKVGKGVATAMRKGSENVYLPGFWRLILFIVKSIPEPIFKRLSI